MEDTQFNTSYKIDKYLIVWENLALMPRRLGSRTANILIRGERVRELRLQGEMTQQEFGVRIDRSDGFVSQLENGNPARVTRQTLDNIARICNVPGSEFLYQAATEEAQLPSALMFTKVDSGRASKDDILMELKAAIQYTNRLVKMLDEPHS
jgi:transcriptional regulator with XRE-family HTH domain